MGRPAGPHVISRHPAGYPDKLQSFPRCPTGRPTGFHEMLWHAVGFRRTSCANCRRVPLEFPRGVPRDPVGSHDTFHGRPIPGPPSSVIGEMSTRVKPFGFNRYRHLLKTKSQLASKIQEQSVYDTCSNAKSRIARGITLDVVSSRNTRRQDLSDAVLSRSPARTAVAKETFHGLRTGVLGFPTQVTWNSTNDFWIPLVNVNALCSSQGFARGKKGSNEILR